MAHNKTKPTTQKVAEFIDGIEDTVKRADCRELMKLMAEITGDRAKMWGAIVSVLHATKKIAAKTRLPHSRQAQRQGEAGAWQSNDFFYLGLGDLSLVDQ